MWLNRLLKSPFNAYMPWTSTQHKSCGVCSCFTSLVLWVLISKYVLKPRGLVSSGMDGVVGMTEAVKLNKLRSAIQSPGAPPPQLPSCPRFHIALGKFNEIVFPAPPSPESWPPLRKSSIRHRFWILRFYLIRRPMQIFDC